MGLGSAGLACAGVWWISPAGSLLSPDSHRPRLFPTAGGTLALRSDPRAPKQASSRPTPASSLDPRPLNGPSVCRPLAGTHPPWAVGLGGTGTKGREIMETSRISHLTQVQSCSNAEPRWLPAGMASAGRPSPRGHEPCRGLYTRLVLQLSNPQTTHRPCPPPWSTGPPLRAGQEQVGVEAGRTDTDKHDLDWVLPGKPGDWVWPQSVGGPQSEKAGMGAGSEVLGPLSPGRLGSRFLGTQPVRLPSSFR